MKNELFHAMILSVLFLLLFFIAEFLYRKLHVRSEITRKIVHAGTGILTMLFPVMLNSWVTVLILCFSFAVILFITIKAKLLPSINAIDRPSAGSLLYPASVFICFVFYKLNNNLLCFYLPVLTLAICDPVAALIGRKWPFGSFIIRYNHKTLSGTFAFFVAALIIACVLLYNMTSLPSELIFRKAVLLGVLTAIAEAVSVRGYDNLTIPATVLLVLKLQI